MTATVREQPGLAKCPTGIRGLDEITQGGLPRGRPTLVCGAAGACKTLLAMEFLVRGAREFGEPGVFVAFEETEAELADNVASLGFDLAELKRQQAVLVDHVHVERSEIEETGAYDLEGLFIRLGNALDARGAKRVVLDSLEALFAGLPNETTLRAELRRLFRWLKDRQVTVLITGEQGNGTLTRHGLEEYVSDCVLFLDHRVINQVATRRVRIVKYRGSAHGTSEYPALIDEQGFSVLPLSSLGLAHPANSARISSGIPRLDAMLGGSGYYVGSSILVTGTAGAGKSSLAVSLVDSVCRRGGRCLYWASEESPSQIVRNMASLGFDLNEHLQRGLLQFHAVRPAFCGLEGHLIGLHKLVQEFRPEVFVMDPISNLTAVGNEAEIRSLLTRVIDHLKSEGITAFFTSLTEGSHALEETGFGVSSLMDTWLLLRMVESAAERNRTLYVVKSRGMEHSNQMREFVLTRRGVELMDVYVGPGVVYTGTERLNQEARDQAAVADQRQAVERRQRELEQQRHTLEAQFTALQAQLANVATEQRILGHEEQSRSDVNQEHRAAMAKARQGAGPGGAT